MNILDLIEKYKPVNPQNLAEELKKLQRAFEESQRKLKNRAAKETKKVFWTAGVTFLITLLAGVIVALFQGWIG